MSSSRRRLFLVSQVVKCPASTVTRTIIIWRWPVPTGLQGYISTADYEGKKTQLVLFINGRSGGHLPCCCTALLLRCAAGLCSLSPASHAHLYCLVVGWLLRLTPAHQLSTSRSQHCRDRKVLLPSACSAAVECTPLKRALEASYAAVLPKACKPFLFLASLRASIAALFSCVLR